MLPSLDEGRLLRNLLLSEEALASPWGDLPFGRLFSGASRGAKVATCLQLSHLSVTPGMGREMRETNETN